MEKQSFKKGFTLIELIFVIVIIGVLSAVAVPKFVGLKEAAEVNAVLKTAQDAFSAIPSAFVNQVDLGNEKDPKIDKLVEIKGKGWTLGTDKMKYTFKQSTETTAQDIVELSLDKDKREVTLKITCSNFSGDKEKKKCNEALGQQESATEAYETKTSF